MPSSDLVGFVPFPPDRAARYRADGYWTERTVDSMLRNAAQHRPSHVGVIDAAGPQRLTFAQLDEPAARAAAGLAALGITAGDRVLLQLPNGCEFAVALFGLLRAGAIPVMCLTGHRATELGHFAKVSDAKALLVPDTAAGFDYRPMARQLAHKYPGLEHVIVDGDPESFVSWSQLSACQEERPAPGSPDPSSPALLLVSGGTTGLPKLIPRTHNDYVYNATASAELCALTADDVYLAALPAAHNFPLSLPRPARRHRGRRHHRVSHQPQPGGGIRRHRAPRCHRHRVGAGIGQPVGPGHRMGAGGADVVAALASWRRETGGRRRPADP